MILERYGVKICVFFGHVQSQLHLFLPRSSCTFFITCHLGWCTLLGSVMKATTPACLPAHLCWGIQEQKKPDKRKDTITIKFAETKTKVTQMLRISTKTKTYLRQTARLVTWRHEHNVSACNDLVLELTREANVTADLALVLHLRSARMRSLCVCLRAAQFVHSKNIRTPSCKSYKLA